MVDPSGRPGKSAVPSSLGGGEPERPAPQSSRGTDETIGISTSSCDKSLPPLSDFAVPVLSGFDEFSSSEIEDGEPESSFDFEVPTYDELQGGEIDWALDKSASDVSCGSRIPDPLELNVIVRGMVADSGRRFTSEIGVGRSIENDVVISGDDTVHRFHLSLVPNRGDGAWWIEVSVNATNRTELNGGDLLAGQRVRLPPVFTLLLGEGTTVQGWSVKPG